MSDDAETYDGAPASIQILGRRFDEEKLLSIAQLVVDALEKRYSSCVPGHASIDNLHGCPTERASTFGKEA